MIHYTILRYDMILYDRLCRLNEEFYETHHGVRISEAYKRGVSNGVVPKSQICKLVAKPAPDIFRIQGVYHNEGFWRDEAALLIRPGLIRPGLCSPKDLGQRRRGSHSARCPVPQRPEDAGQGHSCHVLPFQLIL